jgi:hypothetical protein
MAGVADVDTNAERSGDFGAIFFGQAGPVEYAGKFPECPRLSTAWTT